MLRIGRDTWGLFLYEDGIAGAIGTVILVPIAMVLGPPALIALFVFSLGMAGVVLGVAMLVHRCSPLPFKQTQGNKVVCAWYMARILPVGAYDMQRFYSIQCGVRTGAFSPGLPWAFVRSPFCIGICI